MSSLMNSLDRHYKQHNLLVHENFTNDHAIEEVTKLLLAVLIKHLALGPAIFSASEKGFIWFSLFTYFSTL